MIQRTPNPQEKTILQIMEVFEKTGLHQVSGRNLRAAFNSQKEKRTSGPSFYRMMAKMEDADLIVAFDNPKMVHGTRILERTYMLPETP